MGSLQFVERVRAHDAPTQAQKLRLATSWRRPLIYRTALMRRRAGIVHHTGHAASAIGRGYTTSHNRGSWGLNDSPEERCVGIEGVRTCNSRWGPHHKQKKK